MKNKIFLNLVFVTLFAAGCASVRQPLLSTPAVSMTHGGFPASFKGTESGPVEATYCMGDESITKKGDGTVGLMDEVIAKAETQSKAAYISNARFFYQGANCIVLEGTAVR